MAERIEVGPNQGINVEYAIANLRSGGRVVFLPSAEVDTTPKAADIRRPKPVIDAAPQPRSLSRELDPTVLGRATK